MDDAAVYDPSYLLLKESRESWQHTFSDKVVYALDFGEIEGESLGKVAKDYLDLNLWIECHLTFESRGEARHFIVVIEFDELQSRHRQTGKTKHALVSTDRDPPVLVDITHS